MRAHPRLMVVNDGHQHHFVDVQDAGDVHQRVADVVGRADDRAGPFARLAHHHVVGQRSRSELGERLVGRGDRSAIALARAAHEQPHARRHPFGFGVGRCAYRADAQDGDRCG